MGGTLAPIKFAVHLAKAKAETVARKFPDAVVLGADTIVGLADQILGKPADAADARQMLSLLAGTEHQVISGVAVMCVRTSFFIWEHVTSTVRMNSLSPEQIDAYIATGQWQGKAGGYGIQDSDPFVTRIDGCQTNIVGLPMTTTMRLLSQAGIEPTDTRPRSRGLPT